MTSEAQLRKTAISESTLLLIHLLVTLKFSHDSVNCLAFRLASLVLTQNFVYSLRGNGGIIVSLMGDVVVLKLNENVDIGHI